MKMYSSYLQGDLLSEIRQIFSPWVSQVCFYSIPFLLVMVYIILGC